MGPCSYVCCCIVCVGYILTITCPSTDKMINYYLKWHWPEWLKKTENSPGHKRQSELFICVLVTRVWWKSQFTIHSFSFVLLLSSRSLLCVFVFVVDRQKWKKNSNDEDTKLFISFLILWKNIFLDRKETLSLLFIHSFPHSLCCYWCFLPSFHCVQSLSSRTVSCCVLCATARSQIHFSQISGENAETEAQHHIQWYNVFFACFNTQHTTPTVSKLNTQKYHTFISLSISHSHSPFSTSFPCLILSHSLQLYSMFTQLHQYTLDSSQSSQLCWIFLDLTSSPIVPTCLNSPIELNSDEAVVHS